MSLPSSRIASSFRHPFWRHQLASLAASAVDFGVMIALVSGASVEPGLATLTGASLGAVTNFSLNRRWTFRAEGSTSIARQGLRYLLVASASAMLNALGEHVAVAKLGTPFVATRVVVALLVGALWNFPAQRLFVFRARRSITPCP